MTYFRSVWSDSHTYTISYNANGGSGAPGSQTKIHDVSLNLSSTAPTRSGYIFLGWAKSNTAAAAELLPEEEYTTNASATLYAVWKSVSAFSPVATTIYNGHEYFVYDDAVRWKDAKYLCEQFGGHLVTITNAEENQAVLELAAQGNRPFYCTGATNEGHEETFEWITGEPWSYTNWDEGEPNNYLDTQNYGLIYSTGTHAGYWDDIWDWRQDRGFICEKEPQTCTVSYNANGGSGSVPTEVNYNAGSTVTVGGASGLSKSGFTFKNWNTQPDGTGTSYNPGDTFIINKATTLYAIWESVNPSDFSEWSTNLPPEDATEVESKTVYRYRSKEWKTTTNETLSSPWTQYGTDSIANGNWGEWTTTPATASATLGVESKKQYHYFAFYSSSYAPFTHAADLANPKFAQIWVDSELPYSRTLEGIDVRGNSSTSFGYQFHEWIKVTGTTYGGKNAVDTGCMLQSDCVFTRTVYRSHTITTTRQYWKWGDWSADSDVLHWTETTPTDYGSYDEYESATLYRYKEAPKENFIIEVEDNQYKITTLSFSMEATVVIAQYSEQGEFMSAKLEPVFLQIGKQTIGQSTLSGDFKIMLVDQYFSPLCESYTQ